MPNENTQELTSANIVALIADIFERRGGEVYRGEPVTVAEHVLQGATLAEQGGQPDEIIHNEKGSKFYIYKKKKYGITCEKKFEIDENNMIVGVSSRGCF